MSDTNKRIIINEDCAQELEQSDSHHVEWISLLGGFGYIEVMDEQSVA